MYVLKLYGRAGPSVVRRTRTAGAVTKYQADDDWFFSLLVLWLVVLLRTLNRFYVEPQEMRKNRRTELRTHHGRCLDIDNARSLIIPDYALFTVGYPGGKAD